MKCSLQDTYKIAGELSQQNEYRIFALYGEVGAGKTTFSKEFIKSLGYQGIVSSPTFNIFFQYPLACGRIIYHFDCYRMNNSQDLVDLGIQDILDDPNNIVLIEWPDMIERILIEYKCLNVSFTHIDLEFRGIDYVL